MKLSAEGNTLRLEQAETLTRGTVGQKLVIIFDEQWDTLSKTAVFTSGKTSIDVVLNDSEITIPWELFREKGNKIFVNLYGTANDGSTIITTNIVSLGIVLPSNYPCDTESTVPSPSRIDQIQEIALRAQRMAAVALGIEPKSPTIIDSSPINSSENLITSGGVQKSISRRNLLDNWYFPNPVNQRGKTSYNNDGRYTIDRWAEYLLSCTLTSNGVQLTRTSSSEYGLFYQTFEPDFVNNIGTSKICLSALLSNGELASGVINGFNWGTAYSDERIELYSTDADLAVRIKTTDPVVIIALKAELGDTQTLAHQENGVWVLNELPDFGEELMKCQRYFVNLNISAASYPTFGGNVAAASNVVNAFIPLPVAMRSEPVITVTPQVSNLYLYNGAGSQNLTEINVDQFMGNSIKLYCATSGGLTQGEYYSLEGYNTSILLSADL